MAQFRSSRPEMDVPGPGKGRPPTNFEKLRRHELKTLANAFGIEVDETLPKEEMLVAIKAAEQKGRFRGKPTNERELARFQYPNEPDRWPEEAAKPEPRAAAAKGAAAA